MVRRARSVVYSFVGVKTELRVLGPVQFFGPNGTRVVFTRPSQRRMLAALATGRGQPVSADRLCEILDLSPSGLRTRVRRLRALVGDDVIVTDQPGYALRSVVVDADVFDQRVAHAHALVGTDRTQQLESARALWHGNAYEEFANEEWATADAGRLEELHADLVDDLAELALDDGHPATAVAEMERQVVRQPFRDRSRGVLMRALAAAGRHAEAMRAYQDYRDFLIEETGTEPSATVRNLERQIASTNLLGEGSGATRPTGVVTFLFTDIEGSTRSWHGDPDTMSSVLARHDTIVRDIVENAGGFVFSTAGDGFSVAFSHPVAAMTAAVAVQESLHAAFSTSDVALTVRMGLHTGLAYERGDDYFGPTLNLASRLTTAGSGGQILLTTATEQLVRSAPELANIALVDRGHHQLRDLAEPIGIFEANWDPARAGSLRLHTVSTVPSNVPAVRLDLIGRSDETHTLHDLLDRHRLITLIGPGGAGKSALAIEVAAGRIGRHPDGVFMVDLSALVDPALVIDAIADTVGIRPAGDATASTLADVLSVRSMLIVIDNAEHLIDAVATVVEQLVAVEGPTLLVTSREWLDVRGERTLHLSPLRDIAPSGLTYGAELFIAQAEAAGVSPGTTPGDVAAVEALCARLDHLPLALELAAGSAMLLSPAQILDMLERGEHLDATRRRTGTRRFTSVDEMVGHSFDLLDAHQRSLFLTMATFRGPTSIEAIDGVWHRVAGTPNTSTVLGSLIAKSLVAADQTGRTTRYRMLETIRDFAVERARALGQHDDDQRRHRDWFLEWSERAPTLDQFASYRTASEQNGRIDNLRQSLDYSRASGELDALLRQTVAMHGVWFMLMRGDEGLSWLAACERAATTDAQRLEHVMVSTAAAFSSEHWEYALELAPELLDLSERVDHPLAVFGLSMCGMMKFDDVDAGVELIERAERRDARIRSGFLALTRHLTGDLYLGAGRYERAVERYEAALADYVDDRFFWWITASLANGGLAAHLSGRSTHGLALVERAHDLTAFQAPTLGGHSRSVVNLAVIRSALGDIEQRERRTAGHPRPRSDPRAARRPDRRADRRGDARGARCR